MSALDAERAFAADAQTLGQWTAFRTWAAADATMFVPQPVDAQAWLKDRKDPPAAIDWWPTASYVSCDGSLAVDTGGWKRPDGTSGRFSTVWRRQMDGGWKWVVDVGERRVASRLRPAVTSSKSACPRVPTFEAPRSITPHPDKSAFLVADDGTLDVYWGAESSGAVHLDASRWTGRGFRPVLEVDVRP